MADYQFEMPWPPSVNGYWRSFKGRQIISKRGREYRKAVIAELERIGIAGDKLSERLRVAIKLHPPTLRRYDCDNFTKAVFDALSHAQFWLDDEQVDYMSVEKCEKIKGGKVVVSVYVN